MGIQPFLESGIHCAGIRNPVTGIRNPQRGIQNPRMSWIPLHGAIYNCKLFFSLVSTVLPRIALLAAGSASVINIICVLIIKVCCCCCKDCGYRE